MQTDTHHNAPGLAMAPRIVPTKPASASSAHAHAHPSPAKPSRTGITAAQKQALIENLQLEITERARKLRATYSIHAQSLRTRVEIRVNRIPLALRKAKMGDLVLKYARAMIPGRTQTQTQTAETESRNQDQDLQRKAITAATASTSAAHPLLLPPPVPAKDVVGAARVPLQPTRSAKRPSNAISGGDKENELDAASSAAAAAGEKGGARKKMRTGRGPAGTHDATMATTTTRVLSPASSNTRGVPRTNAAPPSPGKSMIARPPISPIKNTAAAAATNLLSSMVEKARSTRTGGGNNGGATTASGHGAGRKMTVGSSASHSSSSLHSHSSSHSSSSSSSSSASSSSSSLVHSSSTGPHNTVPTATATVTSAGTGTGARTTRRGAGPTPVPVPAYASASAPAPIRAPSRSGARSRAERRISGTSEASDGSTATVVRKTTTTTTTKRTAGTQSKPPVAGAAGKQRTGTGSVMNSLKKGVTGGGGNRKGAVTPVPVPVPVPTPVPVPVTPVTNGNGNGRILRKRG